MICWMYAYFDEIGGKSRAQVFYSLIGILVNCIGLLDGFVWAITNWSNLKDVFCAAQAEVSGSSKVLVQQEVEEVVEISSALRQEFINLTISSIRSSLESVVGSTPLSTLLERDTYESILKKDMPSVIDLSFFGASGQFVEYFPLSFGVLRSAGFQAEPEEIAYSFHKSELAEKFSEGASGSLFFFTSDLRFIIKTITAKEYQLLMKIFPAYFKFMVENRHSSLISRVYAAYSIQLYSSTQYLVIMENIFWRSDVHVRYDLKGSWIGRWSDNPNPFKGVMKDNDLHLPFNFDPERAKELMKSALLDVEFLYSLNIMDYSMLMGVHICSDKPSEPHCSAKSRLSFVSESSQTSVTSEESEIKVESPLFYRDYCQGSKAAVIRGDGIYYMGIIDIFQNWNTSKKLEMLYKVLCRGENRYGISAIRPKLYAERFLLMLRKRLNVSLTCLGEVSGVTVEIREHEGRNLTVVRYKGLKIDNWEDAPRLITGSSGKSKSRSIFHQAIRHISVNFVSPEDGISEPLVQAASPRSRPSYR